MIFRPDLAAKVMTGEKLVTRRLCSWNQASPWWIEHCSFTVGKTFAVCPGRGMKRLGDARVTRCEKMMLGWLTHREVRLEGFYTRDEFEAAFTAINGSYRPSAVVWRVAFEVVS